MILPHVDVEYLSACSEMVRHQEELIGTLASELSVLPGELFYRTMLDGCFQHAGQFDGGAWLYFFHGMECDITSAEDDRFLFVAFGARGCTRAFFSDSIIQYLLFARAPWMTFDGLCAYLLGGAPKPQGRPPKWPRSEATLRARVLEAELFQLGLLEHNDPALFALRQQQLFGAPAGPLGGGPAISGAWGAGSPDFHQVPESVGLGAVRESLDAAMSGRWVISDRGQKFLAARGPTCD